MVVELVPELFLIQRTGISSTLKVYWDEGSTFYGDLLDITNGTCEDCLRIGGMGRPHGTEKMYKIRQTGTPVTIKWLRPYCGTTQSIVID